MAGRTLGGAARACAVILLGLAVFLVGARQAVARDAGPQDDAGIGGDAAPESADAAPDAGGEDDWPEPVTPAQVAIARARPGLPE